MESSISAIAVVAVLGIWHLHNRRHPGWRASSEGRFNICCGYVLVAVAAYWLAAAPTATGWEWVLGNVWALGAMLAFVVGFGQLNRVTADHAWMSQMVESIEPSTGSVPHQG